MQYIYKRTHMYHFYLTLVKNVYIDTIVSLKLINNINYNPRYKLHNKVDVRVVSKKEYMFMYWHLFSEMYIKKNIRIQ